MRPLLSITRLRSTALTAAVVFAGANCSSGELLVTPPDTTIVSLTLDPSTATLRVGATQQLVALGRTASNTTVTTGIEFSSSVPAVASVSSLGVVRALGIGSTIVTAKGGTALKSTTVTVIAGLPAALVKAGGDNQNTFTQTAVSVAPAVQVKDSAGNAISGATVTFAVVSGDGAITGGTVTSNTAGIATVGSWTLGATPGLNTLNATVSGPTAPITTTFSAVGTQRPPGPPATIQISAGDAQMGIVGTALPIAPSVIVREANGQPLAGIPVTFAVVTGGGSLASTNAVTSTSGIATAGSWTLGLAVGAQTVSATVASLPPVTISATATPVPQPPALLAVTRAAAGAARGVAMAVQPVVEIRDASGLLVPTATNVVTVVISFGGRITGTVSVPAVAGVATFTDLTALDQGTFTLTFMSPGLTSATSPLTVTPPTGGAPVLLAVTTQPNGGTNATPLSTQPVIELRDGAGLRSAQATNAVTVTVASGPGTLSGTTTVSAVAGTATFTDLRLSAVGTYTLLFASTGLTSVTSASFTVTPAPAVQMVITTQPTGGTSGTVLPTQPVLQLRDANGNPANTATNAVTVTLLGTGGTLSGTTTVNAVGGIVTFTNLRITGAGTYSLVFNTPGLPAATSTVFTVTP